MNKTDLLITYSNFKYALDSAIIHRKESSR